jgi:hypothetical protein
VLCEHVAPPVSGVPSRPGDLGRVDVGLVGGCGNETLRVTEIDLAPICTSYRRFSTLPGSWNAYAQAYQRPYDPDLVEWFAALREITMIAWLFTLWDLRPQSHSEIALRIRKLDEPAEWNPL